MAGTGQLPRGRHRLSREEVLASQRGRMLAAMAQAVADKGFARATVADVIARAGVSRETFYEQFADKEACFLAAFDAGAEQLLAELGDVVEEAGDDPVERLDRTLAAYFATLAAEPAFTRAFLVEVYGAGPRAIERRAALQQRFVAAIAEIFGARAGTPDRFACEALVAAISSLVTHRVGAGRADEIAALREPVVDLVRRMR